MSRTAQLKEALIEVETDRDAWKHRAEEGGSLFDLRRGTVEQIARVLVENVTPSRVTKTKSARPRRWVAVWREHR